MVCASEKYASEIEIFTFGRGFQARISRSSVQKRRFHPSMVRQFVQTDFFNRIDPKATFQAGCHSSKRSTELAP
ncbi:hypothetical protein CQZ98_16405 [Pseudomonas sp. MYb115]|nr:hypothetical protein CQZ98_16405 [Pseudomonas sp. MYb115]